MTRFPIRFLLGTILLMASCARSESPGVGCGLATMAGPLVVLEAFGRGNAIDRPPTMVPPSLPVRLVAGPVLRGIVGRSDSTRWVIGAEGNVPADSRLGYGVLIVDRDGAARGVMVFDGQPVPGAAVIGSVAVGDSLLTLLGVRVDPATIGDSTCPVFPDSAL